MRSIMVLAVVIACAVPVPQADRASKTVLAYVQGDSSLLPNFVEECKREFAKQGLSLQLTSFDEGFQYNIVIAQESTFGSAAAAAIVIDKKGRFIASVVRSGRMSGNGALNATAKELAKKLAVLTP